MNLTLIEIRLQYRLLVQLTKAQAHLVSAYSSRRVRLQRVIGRPHLLNQPVFNGTITRQHGPQTVLNHFAIVTATQTRCATVVITLAAVPMMALTKEGSSSAPSFWASRAWRASSSFICATMAREA